MKKFSLKDILIPTVALFLIASVCTGILAFTNSATAGKIEENKRQTEMEKRMLVFPDADSFGDSLTASVQGEEHSFVQALDKDGNIIGYVFTTSSKGYGGEVEVMTGINTDGEVTGVETLELNETAGLGMNAKKADFRDQFKDKNGPFVVSKDKTSADSEKDEIDALTGATITSRAVTQAVNTATEIFKTVTGGETNG